MRVRMDWVPVSAALLVTGALALSLGALLLPSTDGTAETLRIVEQQDGRWLAAAAILFLASVCLTLGLPALLTLFDRRGRTIGMVSGIVLEFGFIGTAGYAVLMVFLRSLVRTNALVGRALDDVTHDAGLLIFLYAWIVGFYLGELLLGIALLRARTVPRWVPIVLIAHVATLSVSSLLPDQVSKATILLMMAGFAGIGVHAASRQAHRPLAR